MKEDIEDMVPKGDDSEDANVAFDPSKEYSATFCAGSGARRSEEVDEVEFVLDA